MIDRASMVKALAEHGSEASVSEIMRSEFPVVQENETLEKTIQLMRERGCSTLPVLRNEQLVGLVTLENVGELIMVQSALRDGRGKPAMTRQQRPA
jgi:predicted transcriptional regulator